MIIENKNHFLHLFGEGFFVHNNRIKLVYTIDDNMWLHIGDINDQIKRYELMDAGASADYV